MSIVNLLILLQKQLFNLVFIDLGADYTQSTRYFGAAVTDVYAAGDVVKVYPLAVLAFNDTLGAENNAVGNGVGKGGKLFGDFFGSELLCSFGAPA